MERHSDTDPAVSTMTGPSSLQDFLQGSAQNGSERTLVISQAVDSQLATGLTQQLMVLARESDEPIRLVCSNVPGGDAEAAASVYDVAQSIDAPIAAVASGRISGAGLVVYLAARAADRTATPNARFILEEPRTVERTGDAVSDADRLGDLRRRIVRIIADATGQSGARVREDLADGTFLSGEEAVDYGLADRIVATVRQE